MKALLQVPHKPIRYFTLTVEGSLGRSSKYTVHRVIRQAVFRPNTDIHVRLKVHEADNFCTPAMKIRNLEVSDTRNEIICTSLLITDVESFDQLMLTYDKLAKEFPTSSILISLDELAQSQYTSMHAVMAHDLDDTEGHDLSRVDRSAFSEGEHIGYLSTTSEFFIREDNFKLRSKGVTFEDTCSKGLELNERELTILESLHVAPELVLDEEVVAWVVPVSDPSLALAASPNGYFSCDLTPFENYALASHLYNKYGYRVFGIGASCIGFRRGYPLTDALAQALAQDIARLYNCSDDEHKSQRFLKIVEMNDYLFLKYGEDLDL